MGARQGHAPSEAVAACRIPKRGCQVPDTLTPLAMHHPPAHWPLPTGTAIAEALAWDTTTRLETGWRWLSGSGSPGSNERGGRRWRSLRERPGDLLGSEPSKSKRAPSGELTPMGGGRQGQLRGARGLNPPTH